MSTLFKNLAARDDIDISVYEEPLILAIENNDTNNIALMGDYGSGKSSIIKTFEKKYSKEYNFLNISLADFDNNSTKNDPENVERSILQKMFYTVESSQIPYSRFKRIKDLSLKDIANYTLCLLVWLVSFFVAYKNESLPEYLNWIKHDFIYVAASLIVLAGIFKVLPSIIKNISSFELSNIKFYDGKIGFDTSKDDASILNKNLDEIIYFFKATDYNIVVFEDLDRYSNSIDIYTKLREMNLILNGSSEVKQNITFLYAIRDDNFIGENRTKFFEKIIPVIPIVDFSNSGDQLRKLFKEYKKKNEDNGIIVTTPDNNFIDKISLYVNNLRTIYNIYNEYLIYKVTLKNDKLKENELLTMIVYKNLVSDDFAKLSKNKGIVYTILNKKDELIKKTIDKLNSEIKVLEKEIDDFEKKFVKEINDIKMVFLALLLKEAHFSGQNVHINNSWLNIQTLFTYNHTQFKELFFLQSTTSKNKYFKELKDENNLTFEERCEEQSIKYKDKFIEQINTKRNKIRDIKGLPLHKIIQDIEFDINISQELSTIIDNIKKDSEVPPTAQGEEINKDDNYLNFFTFVISNGYINRYYNYYISKFYAESLSLKDRDFLITIQGDTKTLDYDHDLDNVYKIIDYLDINDFSNKKILNFSILEYLLKDGYSDKLKVFINLINVTRDFEFIDNFPNSNRAIYDIFMNLIIDKCSWLWEEIESSNIVYDKKGIYLEYIFKYFIKNENKAFAHFSAYSDLEAFIVNKENFLSTNTINNSKIIEVLVRLKIKFKKLNKPKDEKEFELFKLIYDNLLFYPNEGLTKTILKAHEQDLSNIDTSHISTIYKSKCDKLIKYIDTNIDLYVKQTVLKIKSNTNEDIEVLIKLLNLDVEKLELKQMKSLLLQTETQFSIESCMQIPTKYFHYIFEQNSSILIHDWKIISYYIDSNDENGEVEDVYILEYLKEYIDDLVKKSITRDIFEYIQTYYYHDNIDIKTFEKLSNAITKEYFDIQYIDLNNISIEKIKILLSANLLQLSWDTYMGLINVDKEQFFQISLLLNNIDDIDELEFELGSEELEHILGLKDIDDKTKNKILDSALNVYADSKANTDKIAELFLTSNVIIPDKTLIELLENLNDDQLENKIDLLNHQFDHLENITLDTILGNLGGNYKLLKESSRKQPTFLNRDYNRVLGNNLKKRDYIYNYTEDGKSLRFYNKPK